MKIIVFFLLLFIGNKDLVVKNSIFANKHYIPFKYTCDGLNVNPDLTIENIPKGTKSLALIMDDTESPNGEFTHWVMWNIPPTGKIKENSSPGMVGKNTHGQNKYYGPCQPNGVHTFNFKVFALNTELNLPSSTDKKMLLDSMSGHVISSGTLTGLYQRQ